jgi:hypothetical protein
MNFLKIAAIAALSVSTAFAQLVTPQGRLSLSSTEPVMNSDVTNATALYYVAYVGTLVPVQSSIGWTNQQTASLPLALTLDSSVQTSGNIYDIFMFVDTYTGGESGAR